MEQMKEIVLRKMKGISYCRRIKNFNSKEILLSRRFYQDNIP